MKIHKTMNNVEIADLLRSVAAAYKIKNENKNKFRIIAYDKAADAIEHLSSEAKDIWDEGELVKIAGVGPSIATHLGEIFKTGKSKHFSEVLEDLPPAIFELLKVPGIGPKKAFVLAKEFKITNAQKAVSTLKKLAKSGKISELERFGKDSEGSILTSIEEHQNKKEERMLMPRAQELADLILDWLSKSPDIKRADTLGSLRRKASTVGDIDLAAATNNPQKALDHFANYPKKQRVLEKGTRTASIIIPGNIQVDLMVETPEAYGALLQHFTGSKHHNIAVRNIAIKKGISISDYGIKKKGKLIKIATEEELYKKIGMRWVPPELREDMGEIDAALHGKLPDLVQLGDVKGDLHMHSSFDVKTSHDDGASSMEKMVEKGIELNYKYMAFTEHNPSSRVSSKNVLAILEGKRRKIDKLNTSVKGRMKIFNSLEVDILPDGSLPLSDEALDVLDFAIVSIHSSFRLSKTQMTKRVLAALSHPKVKIFAHPSARKLNHREGVELDWKEVFKYCATHNKFIEINSSPQRLDLPDFLVKDARESGVKFAINTDSHHVDHMTLMEYGVSVARRGWLTKKDVINTHSSRDIMKLLT